MSGRDHINTQGLQHWSLLRKPHVSRKAEMEHGIKRCIPTTVHSGLNTLSNIFLLRLSRYCFSYQMLHLCSLVLEIRVDLAWKTMRFQMPRTLTAPETETCKTCWRVHCGKQQYPFTSKAAWWETIFDLFCPHFSLVQAFTHYEGT